MTFCGARWNRRWVNDKHCIAHELTCYVEGFQLGKECSSVGRFNVLIFVNTNFRHFVDDDILLTACCCRVVRPFCFQFVSHAVHFTFCCIWFDIRYWYDIEFFLLHLYRIIPKNVTNNTVNCYASRRFFSKQQFENCRNVIHLLYLANFNCSNCQQLNCVNIRREMDHLLW